MTEERFTIISGILLPIRTGIYDNKKLTSEGYGGELSVHDIVDLLNKYESELNRIICLNTHKVNDLINEKEQLQKSVKRQQLSNERCNEYIQELTKENKQLKQFKQTVYDLMNKEIKEWEILKESGLNITNTVWTGCPDAIRFIKHVQKGVKK